MADEPISLGEARAEKTEDARNWTTLEMLRAMIRDIEEGKINPERCIVLYHDIDKKRRWAPRWYVAGVTTLEVYGMLSHSLHDMISERREFSQ